MIIKKKQMQQGDDRGNIFLSAQDIKKLKKDQARAKTLLSKIKAKRITNDFSKNTQAKQIRSLKETIKNIEQLLKKGDPTHPTEIRIYFNLSKDQNFPA